MLKLTLLTIFIVAVSSAPKPDEARYKSRLDTINVDEALKNSRLVDNYIKCALDLGRCTPEASDIKTQILDLLPEILETNCAKCTEEQKDKVRKVLHYLHENKPEKFNAILEKYDPSKEMRTKYKEKYADVAKEEGFADVLE